MKKLFLISSVLLTVIALSGCSNHISPRQADRYNQIDSEAETDLGAIFTDETAFNAMNNTYISAGYYSTKGLNLSVNIIPHSFYAVKAPIPSNLPFKCSNGIIKNNLGKIKAGFSNIGFLPRGPLHFYYFIKTFSNPSKTLPAKLSAPPVAPSRRYVSCGKGFEAFAVTNIHGNIQVYAVDDYSPTPTLIYGKSYRKYIIIRQNVRDTQNNTYRTPPPPPSNLDLYKTN